VFDNLFIERLWQYAGVEQAVSGLDAFFRFYNEERRQQALAYRTSWKVLQGRVSGWRNTVSMAWRT